MVLLGTEGRLSEGGLDKWYLLLLKWGGWWPAGVYREPLEAVSVLGVHFVSFLLGHERVSGYFCGAELGDL